MKSRSSSSPNESISCKARRHELNASARGAVRRSGHLECRENGAAIIEAHVQDATEPLLQLLDLAAEDPEIVGKLVLVAHVKHVKLASLPPRELLLEIGVHALHVCCERAALVSTDLHALQLLKLSHRFGKVEQIVAPAHPASGSPVVLLLFCVFDAALGRWAWVGACGGSTSR